MRIIAHDVEYYFLARDCPEVNDESFVGEGRSTQSLSDSLWLFDGSDIKAWTDVQLLLDSGSTEYARDVSPSIKMPIDYYPLAMLLHRGIIFGVEAELAQGRDADFSAFRSATRVSAPPQGT